MNGKWQTAQICSIHDSCNTKCHFEVKRLKTKIIRRHLRTDELVAGRAIFKLGGNITLVKRHMSLTLHT